MKRPKVSICLATCDGENFLHQAIDSALNQTIENMEVVIVDDCSADKTREILQHYARMDKRVRLTLNEQKLEAAESFSKALALCCGQYIKPLVQDDVLKPDCLKVMLSAIDEIPTVALVGTAQICLDDDGIEIAVQHNFETADVFAGHAMIKLYLREMRNRIGSISQMLFRKDDLQIGLEADCGYSGETELALRLCQLGDFSYLAEPLVVCRVAKRLEESRSQPDISFALEQMRLVDRFAPYLAKHGMTNERIWSSMLRGLIEKMSGVAADNSHFPVPTSFSHGQYADDGDPKVFSRLAGYMIKYLADRHMHIEESLLQAKRQRLRAADENERLLKRMKELEEEHFKQNLECENVKHDAETLQAEIARLKTSKSWKLTKPLRQLRRTH